MKYSTLATLSTATKAISVLAITALSTSAFAAPDIYGQIRVSFTNTHSQTTKDGIVTHKPGALNFNTGNSRIGFKDSNKLNDKTQLEYQLEYKVDVAKSTSTNFSARQGWIALKNQDYGRLQVGRTLSRDSLLMSNALLWGTGIGPFAGHGSGWANNSFLYTTPKFNDNTTTAFVHYGMDGSEKDTTGNKNKKGSRSFTTFKNGEKTSVSRDFVIFGAQYTKDKLSLNTAYTRAGQDLNSLLGSGEYKLDDRWSVNGKVQYADYNSKNNELAVLAGVAYKPKDKMTTWAELSYTDNYQGYGNGKATGVNIGASYDINKNLLGFANAGFSKEEYHTTKTDKKGVELGAIYRF